jgi:hypothetical protein
MKLLKVGNEFKEGRWRREVAWMKCRSDEESMGKDT